jgi:hypothetical protein
LEYAPGKHHQRECNQAELQGGQAGWDRKEEQVVRIHFGIPQCLLSSLGTECLDRCMGILSVFSIRNKNRFIMKNSSNYPIIDRLPAWQALLWVLSNLRHAWQTLVRTVGVAC